jgi:tRNA-(ms[2]io[6]A)-hydroxylase
VLQQTASADDGRPAWHWTLIGGLFALSIWVPLAMLGSGVGGRVVQRIVGEGSPDALADQLARAEGSSRAALWFAVTAVPMLSFAVACLAAGALVGRFGSRAGKKEAAQGSALAAAVGALLTVAQAGWASSLMALLVLAPLGAGAGWLGGRLGVARRPFGERRPG